MPGRSPKFYIFVIAAAFLAIVIGGNVVGVMMKPGDEAQIREAIETMREASLAGRPGGVLEYLSDSFQSEWTEGDFEGFVNPKAEVGRFLRQARVTRIQLSDLEIQVEGDKAQVTCSMDADFELASMKNSYKGPLQLVMKREPTKRLFIIPDPTWKVTYAGGVDMESLRAY